MDRSLVQKAAAIDMELQGVEAMTKALRERWSGDPPASCSIRYKDLIITVAKEDMVILLDSYNKTLQSRLTAVGVDLKP